MKVFELDCKKVGPKRKEKQHLSFDETFKFQFSKNVTDRGALSKVNQVFRANFVTLIENGGAGNQIKDTRTELLDDLGFVKNSGESAEGKYERFCAWVLERVEIRESEKRHSRLTVK